MEGWWEIWILGPNQLIACKVSRCNREILTKTASAMDRRDKQWYQDLLFSVSLLLWVFSISSMVIFIYFSIMVNKKKLTCSSLKPLLLWSPLKRIRKPRFIDQLKALFQYKTVKQFDYIFFWRLKNKHTTVQPNKDNYTHRQKQPREDCSENQHSVHLGLKFLPHNVRDVLSKISRKSMSYVWNLCFEVQVWRPHTTCSLYL